MVSSWLIVEPENFYAQTLVLNREAAKQFAVVLLRFVNTGELPTPDELNASWLQGENKLRGDE